MVPRLGAKSFCAAVVAAAAAALVGVCALSAPARGAPATPFREVAEVNGDASVQSDGVRFALVSKYGSSAVRVFDTLRGRNFRLPAPKPECNVYSSIGGGLVAWSCASSPRILLTDLSSGRSRAPAGIDRVEPDLYKPPVYGCLPQAIGSQWLKLNCGAGLGPRSTRYFNHRDGRLTGEIEPPAAGPFIDLDHVDLFRPKCAPLEREWLTDYERPFALQWAGWIRLRRCGRKRAETLSRCLLADCRTPQLGSDYVTWGEHKRVYAYLPRTRRRVLVGRAPANFIRGRKLSVAHTCNHVFARWGDGIYMARFEPREGAPRCQTAS